VDGTKLDRQPASQRPPGPSSTPLIRSSASSEPTDAPPPSKPPSSRRAPPEAPTPNPAALEPGTAARMKSAAPASAGSANSAFSLMVAEKGGKKSEEARLASAREAFVNKTRKPFRDDIVLRRKRHDELIERMRKEGFTQELSDALWANDSGIVTDAVTGWGRAEERYPSVLRAILHVSATDEAAFYIEIDIRNLGGLNHKLGHTGANKIYRAFTDAIQKELAKLPADMVPFRHGGDEVSVLLVGPGITQADVEEAMEEATRRALEIAAKEGLSDLPHPKHPGQDGRRGTGITFGIAKVMHSDTPEKIFTAADLRLEIKKDGG
jgi:GGDEF domain-containing protein